jgi:hypothetical protein
MRTERIRIHESHNVFSLLFYSLLILIVSAASIIATLNILIWLKPVDVHLTILVLVGIGVAPTTFMTWLLSLGRKANVTPILHVDGTVSNMSKTPDSPNVGFVSYVGDTTRLNKGRLGKVVGAFLSRREGEPTCIKFTLCEEGIVLYRSGHTGLVRWDRIHKLKADHENKSFELTVKMTLGKDSFLAQDRFEEVRQMLSERISVN